MSYRLPFSKEFPSDYQTLQPKPTPIIIVMKDNLFPRMLMLEDVDMRDQAKNEMELKLKKYKDGYTES